MVKIEEKIEDKNKNNTLFILRRVSTTKQQNEGESLESQLNIGLKRMVDLGLKYYEDFNEGGISGSKNLVEYLEKEELEGGNLNDRIVLKKLMNKIVNGDVKHLFVYENDRLSRNENLWNYIRVKLKENDVTLYTKSTTLNLSDKKDDLFFGILSEFSKFENELRGERLKEGRRQKVKKGFWFGGGKGVFGYDVIDKKLVISKYESKWVRKIMKMYGDGVKISDIILNLRENGVKTKSGNLVFSDGSLEKIVRNTYYLGYFHYLDDRIENESLKFIDEDEELYKNVLTRIEYNRKRKYSKNHKKEIYPYHLTTHNLLFCGKCDVKMGGRSNWKTKNSTYYCMNRVKKYEKERFEGNSWEKWNRNKNIEKFGLCDMTKGLECNITDLNVFEVVLNVVKYSRLNRENFKKMMFDRGVKNKNDKQKEIGGIKRKIRDLDSIRKSVNKRFEEIEVDLIHKKITKTRYNSTINLLEKELFKVENDIEKLNNEMVKVDGEKDWIDWYGDYMNDVKLNEELVGEDRIEFIKRYVSKIDVYYEKDLSTHILKLNFKLPLVNDKLVWNSKSKKDGYVLKEGRNTKLLFQKKNIRLDGRKMRNINV